MATTFLDPATGRELPCCRECGSLCVTRDGRVTCSACGYVAGTALAVADTLPNVVLARNLSGGKPDKILLGLALAEARDEGHAAGRAEATSLVIGHLAELARMDRVPCRHYRECNCREVLDREQVMTELMAIKRALVGKL